MLHQYLFKLIGQLTKDVMDLHVSGLPLAGVICINLFQIAHYNIEL